VLDGDQKLPFQTFVPVLLNLIYAALQNLLSLMGFSFQQQDNALTSVVWDYRKSVPLDRGLSTDEGRLMSHDCNKNVYE
jgi:hypothetical protein